MDPVAITVAQPEPVGARSFHAPLSRLGKLPLWHAILAVLAGQVTVTEACQELGMSRSGFYKRLARVLEAVVWALTDRRPGRPRRGMPRSWPEALEALKALRGENAQLRLELRRERLARVGLQAQVYILRKALRRAGEELLTRLGTAYLRFTAREKHQILAYLEEALELGDTVKGFAGRVGKCYQTLLAWRATWQARAPGQGLEVLQDRSSLPEGHRRDPAVIREVQKVKATHPDWGAQQIALHLRRRQAERVAISPSAVRSLLKAYPVSVDPEARLARRKKLHTFGQPNLVACVDWLKLKLGCLTLHLVVVMDEATRFITAWRLSFRPSTAVALAALKDAIRIYGPPLVVKTDNGPEFRKGWRQRLGALGLFCLNSPLRYAPFNGKLERCLEAWRRFSRCRETLALLEALGEGIRTWVHEHNYLVYNENLGGLTPSQAFLKRQPIQPPEHVEVVQHRREGDQLILKFTNRDGRPARKVLTLGA